MVHAQTITSVQFTPNDFSECQLVDLTVHGTIPGNATINSFVPGQMGNTITVELIATGSGGGNSNFNQTVPGLGPYPPGNYTFQVTLNLNGNVVATNNTSKTVSVGVDPDAGEFAQNTSVCLAGPSINLFNMLGGAPDPGGVWTGPFGDPHAGTFVPGTDLAGSYTYTIEVLPPCTTAVQSVYLQYAPTNDPGMNGGASTCQGAAPFDLFSYLLGTPDAGGAWTYQGNNHSSTFDPSTDPAGPYTYTVPAIAPCPAPSATVTVSFQSSANAGIGGNVVVCSTDTSYALADGLGGNPDQSGSWYDPFGFLLGNYMATMVPALNGGGTYLYVVGGNPCPADTAELVVSVLDPPCNIGIEEIGIGLTHFELVPNPSDGAVAIELASTGRSKDMDLRLNDASGRTVLAQKISASGVRQVRAQLDLGHLAGGIYTVRLSNTDGAVTRRLVLH